MVDTVVVTSLEVSTHQKTRNDTCIISHQSMDGICKIEFQTLFFIKIFRFNTYLSKYPRVPKLQESQKKKNN